MKLKQLHRPSEIPKLKRKLLSSTSTTRKLTCKNKELKTEQLLNQTFSQKTSNKSHQSFGTMWFAS